MNSVAEFPDNQLIKEEASAWLIRLDADQEISSEERAELVSWVNQSTRHRHELYALAKVWENMNILTELSMPVDEKSRKQIHARSKSRQLIPLFGLAATLVIALTVGKQWVIDTGFMKANGSYQTMVGEQRSIALTDQSSVMLNTNSQIRIEYSGQYRDVYLLKGESHFTVRKDSQRPFRVFAANGRIDAVGTAFTVYINDEGVDVTVTEGVVNLFSFSGIQELDNPDSRTVQTTEQMQQSKLVSLSVGQFATILPELSESLNSNIADVVNLEPRALSRKTAWTEGSLIFSGETLAQVVNEVSRYTDLNIEFSDEKLGAIRVGGVFPAGETEIMFDVLESTFGLDIAQVSESRVIISQRK